MDTVERLRQIFADAEFETIEVPDVPVDPLKFKDQKKYIDRLKDARAKTGRKDAVTVAVGSIENIKTVVAVQDFTFMGGSLGMAAGEAGYGPVKQLSRVNYLSFYSLPLAERVCKKAFYLSCKCHAQPLSCRKCVNWACHISLF